MRHGETESPGLICGHLDLSDRGREQSVKLAQLMIPIPIVAVYSSDLRRASFMAEMIARPHGVLVRRAPDLHEINMGQI
jgi:broad specificity phosphatase PhoE